MARDFFSLQASNSELLSHRFEQALIMAFRLHLDQNRKASEVPYVAHLLGVTSLVLEAGGEEDEAIAALLHDAVEDQGGQDTLRRIRNHFGDRVAEIVAACSDSTTVPKPSWRKRKVAYLKHIRKVDPGIRRVSLADKLHNCRDILLTYRRIGEAIWDRFKGGKDGTLWYYGELNKIFMQTGEDELTLEFNRVFTTLTELVAASQKKSI